MCLRGRFGTNERTNERTSERMRRGSIFYSSFAERSSGRLKKKKDAHMMLYITHVNFQGLEIILQGVLREERR